MLAPAGRSAWIPPWLVLDTRDAARAIVPPHADNSAGRGLVAARGSRPPGVPLLRRATRSSDGRDPPRRHSGTSAGLSTPPDPHTPRRALIRTPPGHHLNRLPSRLSSASGLDGRIRRGAGAMGLVQFDLEIKQCWSSPNPPSQDARSSVPCPDPPAASPRLPLRLDRTRGAGQSGVSFPPARSPTSAQVPRRIQIGRHTFRTRPLPLCSRRAPTTSGVQSWGRAGSPGCAAPLKPWPCAGAT